jgi:hypothetical protein
MTKLRMICSKCHSEDVLSDAYAAWDFDQQQWVVSSSFDKGAYCNNCDGECRIESMALAEGVS